MSGGSENVCLGPSRERAFEQALRGGKGFSQMTGGNSMSQDREVRKGMANLRRDEDVTVGGKGRQTLDFILEMMANHCRTFNSFSQ